MKYALSDFTLGIETLLRDTTGGMRAVTVFCSPKNPKTQRVRVTRRGKSSLVVTFGRPNYRERQFLKLCAKAKTHPKKTFCWAASKKKK